MAPPGDRLGLVASVAQLTGVDALGLRSMILQAAHIARRNRDQCLQLAQHVEILNGVLRKLLPKLRRHPETRRSLDQLNDTLLRALELVRSCSQQQEKTSWVYQIFTGPDVADKLRQAQEDIDFYIKLIPAITTIAIFPDPATYQDDDETNDLTPAQRPSLSLELIPFEEPPPTGTVVQQPIIDIVGNVVSQQGYQFLPASYLLNQDDETNDLTLAQRPSLSLEDVFERLALEEPPPTGTVVQQPIIDIVGNVVSHQVLAEQQQSSGPSSCSWIQLETATNGFAPEAVIGEGSLGIVYRGVLPDGRELAIKRCKSEERAIWLQHKNIRSRLGFLSRLRHKHLVGLMGYGNRNDECLFVYEYMKNGSLHDHINSFAAPSLVTKSWRLRFKILLDASRGIEYLHSNTVPYCNIKSSNIMLDGEWTARVSDFGHSLMEPGKLELDEMNGLDHTGTDISWFGEVMAEVLTGKRKICGMMGDVTQLCKLDSRVSASNGNELSALLNRIEFCRRPDGIAVLQDWKDVQSALDVSVSNDLSALESVAYTAARCISFGESPSMAEIVAILERAVSLSQED